MEATKNQQRAYSARQETKQQNHPVMPLRKHNLPKLLQMGMENYVHQAFMPKESIILVLRSFLLLAGTFRMQFFGVTVLNEHLKTLCLAECFRCLCNFPFLTWESIPCKTLNMPYKKESVFYVALLFCIWCFHKHTSITLFIFETTAVPQCLAQGWPDSPAPCACVQGWKSFLFSQLLLWALEWGKEARCHWRPG